VQRIQLLGCRDSCAVDGVFDCVDLRPYLADFGRLAVAAIGAGLLAAFGAVHGVAFLYALHQITVHLIFLVALAHALFLQFLHWFTLAPIQIY
jgi:hypothetical protein